MIKIPRGLPRAHYRWGFSRGVAVHYSTGGESVALPFGQARGFNPVVAIT